MSSLWTGYLKLSVVTCPVSMAPMPAENDILRFQGFGRQAEEILADQEVEALFPRSFHTIDIRIFAPAEVTACMWFEAPYFLMPDDLIGMEAYAVIRDVMRSADMVGLSWLTLCDRRHPVVIEPRETGVALWSLNEIDESCEANGLGILSESRPDPAFRAVLDQLIAERIRRWSPEQVTSPVRERLFDLAGARKKTQRRPRSAPSPSSSAEVIILGEVSRPAKNDC
jgi:DNA end-binding protein Ku